MIVVVGSTFLRGDGPDAEPDGLAGRIAVAAAASGAAVELIAKVGDDPTGDALLVALARAGVGHVAVLRDPVHPTVRRPGSDDVALDVIDQDASPVPAMPDPDPGPSLDVDDVGLALRYLTELGVVVAVHPTPGIVAEASSAAGWANGHLVVVTRPGDAAPTGIPAGSLVLEVVDDGVDDPAIGSRLGIYAAAVDGGTSPADAYADLTAEPSG